MNRKKFIIPLMLVFVFAFVSCSSFVNLDQTDGKELGYLQIDAEQAKTLMDTETDYIILDVRTEEEYNEGHIEGSLLIPLDTLEANLPKLANSKDRPLIVYCRSGARSAIASRLLADQGFKPLNVSGGINEWSAAKLPLAK